jgi:ribosomal protein S18 acetylase RimI-like enzyme
VAGSIADVITYLEMTEKPARAPRPVPLAKLALLRTERCTASFYRYLYNTVGEPWVWYLRRLWNDEQLRDHLARAEIEVFVLYSAGVPAGYYELERATSGETELCYFGLVPDFIGKGLGHYFLQAAVDNAWLGATRRLWVHTSTFDHPRALGLYQRAGFRVYRRETMRFEDPRLSGALPRNLLHPLLPPLPPG